MGEYAAIGGGYYNAATQYGFVGGGVSNVVEIGMYGVVDGGFENIVGATVRLLVADCRTTLRAAPASSPAALGGACFVTGWDSTPFYGVPTAGVKLASGQQFLDEPQ